MPEKCTNNPRDCPLIPRLEALKESKWTSTLYIDTPRG